MDDRLNFGVVITVIEKQLVKFKVERLKNRATSYDPVRNWPVTYVFSPETNLSHPKDLKPFRVKVRDQFIWGNYNNDEEHPKFHTEAIRFGLNQIMSDLSQEEFVLDNDSFEKIKSKKWLQGRKLTEAIKKFFYEINNEWQMQGISHFDILDNFYADENEVDQSMRFLKHEQFISKVGSGKFRENRGATTTSTYNINPQKFDEIEAKFMQIAGKHLVNSEKLKIFISYSTKNRKTASDLKEQLEKYGMEVFLAHQTIRVSQQWQERILEELNECQVFIAIITKDFIESDWTDQEAGFAMAFGKKIFPIITSKRKPYGFLNRYQGVRLKRDKTITSKEIIESIAEDESFSQTLRNNLMEKLRSIN